MKKYWELNTQLPNSDNQQAINQYLLKLKDADRTENTIRRYRAFLQRFFMNYQCSYSLLTEREISQWFKEQSLLKQASMKSYLKILCSFYSFCLKSGFLKKTPFSKNDLLLNKQNERIILSFLESLKVENKSNFTIKGYRSCLLIFFHRLEFPIALVTGEGIHKWLNIHCNGRTKSTKERYLMYLRNFFKYCVEKGYIEHSPLLGKRELKKVTTNYWEVKRSFSNTENQRVVNDFLKNLRDKNRKEITITKYRRAIEIFFKDRKQLFSSLTSATIHNWLETQRKEGNKTDYRKYFGVLRGFYRHCVDKGYMKKSPIKSQVNRGDDAKDYWEVNNSILYEENKKVINEFLCKLKKIQLAKKTIINHRWMLQSFFQEKETLFSAIHTQEINKWIDGLRRGRVPKTIEDYLNTLRCFFKFCVDQGYMEQNPIQYRYDAGKDKEYWVVQEKFVNPENEDVLNEYLLSMKVANMSKHTIIIYGYYLGEFLKKREILFSDLSPDEILRWILDRKKDRGWKETTLSRFLTTLSSFYNFCVGEGYLEKSLIKHRWYPLLPKPVPKYLENEEVAKLRNQSDKELLRDRTLLEFLLSSGCRIGEVHELDRSNLDLENRTATVIGKGRKVRQVHFSEKCAFLLERYLDSRVDNNPALFVSIWENRLSTDRMRGIVKKMGLDAEIKNTLHPHRLRHTFATDLLSKGADLAFISEELGHTSLHTTQVYARLPNQQIISMYRKYMG